MRQTRIEATYYSKEMVETEYHLDYYASNLEPSHEKSVLSSNICYHKAPEKSCRKSI